MKRWRAWGGCGRGCLTHEFGTGRAIENTVFSKVAHASACFEGWKLHEDTIENSPSRPRCLRRDWKKDWLSSMKHSWAMPKSPQVPAKIFVWSTAMPSWILSFQFYPKIHQLFHCGSGFPTLRPSWFGEGTPHGRHRRPSERRSPDVRTTWWSVPGLRPTEPIPSASPRPSSPTQCSRGPQSPEDSDKVPCLSSLILPW